MTDVVSHINAEFVSKGKLGYDCSHGDRNQFYIIKYKDTKHLPNIEKYLAFFPDKETKEYDAGFKIAIGNLDDFITVILWKTK